MFHRRGVIIEKKSAIERRKITYKVIEEDTGIRTLTLSRIVTNHNYNISKKLLVYFNCKPNELMTYISE